MENRDAKNHYETSNLTTYPADVENREYALLYNQVCSTWKQLVDIRFKLLGLVPTVSIGLIYTLLSSERLTRVEISFIALIGFIVTLAIKIYDQRNTELHDQLISRGRKLEEEMGVENGIFIGRRKSAKRFIGIKVQHDVALAIIYWTSLSAWIAIGIGVWINLFSFQNNI